jgi:hypothetical protein
VTTVQQQCNNSATTVQQQCDNSATIQEPRKPTQAEVATFLLGLKKLQGELKMVMCVVTLWLHCGYTAVTLWLLCCYTMVALWATFLLGLKKLQGELKTVMCVVTLVTLWLHCCYTMVTLLLYCGFTVGDFFAETQETAGEAKDGSMRGHTGCTAATL